MLFKSTLQIFRYVVLILVLGGVVGCNSPITGVCVDADNFGDAKYTDLTLNAKGKIDGNGFDGNGWIYSGLVLEKGRPLQIRTYGEVDICTDEKVSYNMPINVNQNGWAALPGFPGVDVGVAELEIIAEGSFCTDFEYKIHPARNSKAEASNDGNCERIMENNNNSNISYSCSEKVCAVNSQFNNGEGIMFSVGDSAPDPSFAGDPSRDSANNYSYIARSNPSESNPVYQGVVPKGDNIFFRVAENWKDIVDYKANGECAVKDGCDNPWSGDYTNNHAIPGFTITVKTKMNCKGSDGDFLLASIGGEGDGTIIDLQNNKIIENNEIAEPKYEIGSLFDSGMFNGFAPASGKLYFRIIEDPSYDWNFDGKGDQYGDTPVDYSNNKGAYGIEVKTQVDANSWFSGAVNGVIGLVKGVMYGNSDGSGGIIERLYKGVVSNTGFIDGVRAVIALSIVLMALGYIAGVNQMGQKEIVIYVLKLSVVLAVISDTSWEFFYNHLYIIFVEGIDELIKVFASPLSSALTDARGIGDGEAVAGGLSQTSTATFEFLDETLGRFWTAETWAKMSGILTMFPMGLIYFTALLAGIIMYMMVIIKAVLIYVMALIMIGLLLFLGPVIIIFILFSRTQEIFMGWVKYLMNFAIQPILVFAVLSIFNVFVYNSFYLVLSYDVCWRCAFFVDLPISEIWDNKITGDFDRFCLISFFIPWGGSGAGDLSHKLMNTPVGWFSILTFVIMVYIMYKFIDWVISVSITLTAGGEPIGLNAAAENLMSQASQGIKDLGSFAKGYGDSVKRTAQIGGNAASAAKKRLSGKNNAKNGVKDKTKDSDSDNASKGIKKE